MFSSLMKTRSRRRAVVAGLGIILGAFPAMAQSTGSAHSGPTMASTATDSLAIARKYTAWFFTGQVDSLWAHQSAEGKKSNTPGQAPAVDP